MRYCKLNSSQETELIDRYQKGTYPSELSKIYSIDRTSCYNIFKRYNVDTHKNKFWGDETVFENITPESAYWIGFLMADGCVTDINKVQLQLHQKDRKQIEKFKNFIGSHCNVTDWCYNGKPHSGIVIRSLKLVKDLEKYGVGPRKSFTAIASDEIKNNKDFWRGMIDGDGCIMFNPTKKYFRLDLTGTYKICEQFLDFVKQQLQEFVKIKICKNNSVFVIRVNGKQAAKIIRILYSDAIVSLDRKYLLAQQFITYYR